MQISYLKNTEWKNLKNFIKKNIGNNILSKKKFTSYWFSKNNKNWQVQIAKNKKNQIKSINFFIKSRVKFYDKKINAIFTSVAYSKKEIRKFGIIGKILINLHRKYPLVFSLCGNKDSLPINNILGKKIKNTKLNRFIYINKSNCLKLVQKKFRNKIKMDFKKTFSNSDITTTSAKSIPKNINNLWKIFSKEINICVIKDYNYLVWRYKKSPFQNYSFFIFKKNNKLIGFAVIKLQNTKFGLCARIIDIIVNPEYFKEILNEILIKCNKIGVLFTDFIHIGNIFNANFRKSGFKHCTNKSYLSKIPNLLSPIEYREWTNSFHIGGNLINDIKLKLNSNIIWFTKGDGDRDWPTISDLK